MSKTVRAYQSALIRQEYEHAMSKLAALRSAMEHSSPEAMAQYLKEHPDADRSNHTVKKQPKLLEGIKGLEIEAEGRGMFPKSKGDDKEEKKPSKEKKSKPKTYAQAQEGVKDQLKKDGWKMSAPGLKVPYATSPDGKTRLWFKGQAVYKTQGERHDFGNARTVSYDTNAIKTMDPKDWVKHHAD